jgi:amino acid adenylation domain-containing protein/non-ribosomal peptide synthase protein (TIGR01720 family)
MRRISMKIENQFIQMKQYWEGKLSQDLPHSFFPMDAVSKTGAQNKQAEHHFILPDDLALKIIQMSGDSEQRLAIILAAGLIGLLSRYNQTDDYMIFLPINKQKETANFINTLLPLRNSLTTSMSYKELVLQVWKDYAEATDNQNYPVERLLQKDIPAIIGKGVLSLGTAVLLENIHDYRYISHIDFRSVFSFYKNGLKIRCTVKYDPTVYALKTIEGIASHFLSFLQKANPDIPVKDIDLLTAEEKDTLLYEFNNTKAEYPKDKTIQELFEEQVEKTPDNIAVVFEDKQLTYLELNEKSNQLARVLREKGIKPGSIVGIMAKQSLEMVEAILAVLKAGGAYLPIDPEYPGDRIRYMLEDSNTSILLTSSSLSGKVNFRGEILPMEDGAVYNPDSSNPEKVNQPSHLAYVIYTSGSTGKPKGVMIEHKSLVNLCKWHIDYYNVTGVDRSTKYAGFGFDASVWEIFPYMLAGASIHIIPDDIKLDVRKLNDYFEKNDISISFLPTQLCQQFMEIKNRSLRKLLTGGDKLSSYTKQDYELVNNYGPTENTVVTASFKVDGNNGNLPIGKPVYNNRVYIIDRYNHLQPVGTAGELCISGDSLARGYLNRPELTAEKFVDNPFLPEERMYRTGDLARWLPDGNIEFLGRIDHQVKIRGFRIELGEIETRLLKYASIKEAVVMAREETQDSKYLCAYIVGEKEITVSEIREHLSKELPDYMIPSYFIQLDKMPLTQNGKIDRKALPEHRGSIDTGAEYVAPRNEKEETLVRVWEEVLNAERISIRDNFFSIGGDSIKTIQVLSRLNKYGLKLEMKEMFRYPVIEELVNYVQTINRKTEQTIVEGEGGLTPIQRWMFEQSFTDKHHFNQAVMLYRKEGFAETVIRKVFTTLAEHHDALRMIYKAREGEIVQYNRGLKGDLFSLEAIDLTNNDNYREVIEQEASRIQGSIDLNNGPLVKLGLFNTTEGDHLLIAIHHLVVDGVSWRIILEDLAVGYMQAANNEEIKFMDKTDSFKDWSAKLHSYAHSKELLKEIEYWTRIEEAKVKPLPKDQTIAERKCRDNDNVHMELTEEETEKLLKQVNKAYNTEINDILLTALGLAVKEWTGEDRVLINLEGHGREEIIRDIDVSRTVGWFTTQYPVALDMSGGKLSHSIKTVKENIRRIPGKGIGYGILKYLTLPENKETLRFVMGPEISFNYLGQFDVDIDTGVFSISDISTGESMSLNMESQYSIDINGMVAGKKLTLNFTYNKGEYEEDTIVKIVDGFRENLVNIIYHCAAMDYTEFSPSDISNKSLTLDEVEDIYKLLEKKIG